MKRCPGFRFHPTDVELVMFHLKRKLMGKKLVPEVIAEVNIYDFSPWDLPDKSNLRNGDLEWFFYCPKSKKYSSGSRTNRATEAGYWKATGKDREVKYKGRIVAMIKTLIFHQGHPPKGTRTDWVMHEFRMEDKDLANAGVAQEAFVLCRLFEKSGVGPKNGAQYGAPFKEEEWDDDTEEVSLSGAFTETVNPTGSCSTLSEMTCTVPEPSISPYFESERHLEKCMVTSSTIFGLFEASKAPIPYASSSGVMNLTSPSTATSYEVERHLEKSLTSSAHTGMLGAREMVIPYANSSMAMNLNSIEPGPSTITSLENESYHVFANDDAVLTSEDIASLLHNNTQETENCKGKKITTDAHNEDDVIVLDSAALSTFDDLSLDGFDMFNVDGSANVPMDAFTLDDLDDDLYNFF